MEVVKFACGLANDPTTLVERVSELFVDDTLSEIPIDLQDFIGYSESNIDRLIAISKEIKDKGISPFCNRFLHYPLQITVPMSSKLHIFGPEIPPMWTEDAYRTAIRRMSTVSLSENTDLLSCSIIIKKPSMSGNDVFSMISELNQSIANFCIEDLHVEEKTGKEVKPEIKMDANGKFIVVDSKLPSVLVQQLVHQSTMYHKMEVFWVEKISPMEEFVAKLPALQNLTCLKLSDCGLSNEHTSKLCAQLKFVLNLKKLDLSDNDIGSAGAMLLAESIESWGSHVQLEELRLEGCELCEPGSSKLMDALSICQNMSYLSVSWNEIGNEGCQCLARSIASWGSDTELKALHLQDCEFDVTGILAVMKALKHSESLAYLTITGNNINGLFTELDKELDWELLCLEYLLIGNTALSEEDIQALASLLHVQLLSLDYIGLGYDISNLQGDSDETLMALRAIQSLCEVDIYEGSDILYDHNKIEEKLEEEERRRGTDG